MNHVHTMNGCDVSPPLSGSIGSGGITVATSTLMQGWLTPADEPSDASGSTHTA